MDRFLIVAWLYCQILDSCMVSFWSSRSRVDVCGERFRVSGVGFVISGVGFGVSGVKSGCWVQELG